MLQPQNPVRQRYVYHFTPIANLASILEHGLLSKSERERLGLAIPSLGWTDLQDLRSQTPISAGPGGRADEYVPLYFSKLSPMLLILLNNKVVDESEILFFEFPLAIIDRYPFVFTDMAIFPGASPQYYIHPADLEKLNWDLIDMTTWHTPTHTQRLARMAELLIYQRLLPAEARRLIAWDETAARKARAITANLKVNISRIEVDPGCYFIEYGADEPQPAVIGPNQIYEEYLATLESIAKAPATVSVRPRYASLEDLRQSLWHDLASLPETAELIDLETDNRAHKEDVGAHTRRVVQEVTRTSEYQRLDEHARLVLEVAAFLHDTGKGPKSRWLASGGRQQIDFNHPVKALPMVRRILTEEVEQVDPQDARLIAMLVAYHDIIGGILFSGRRLEELLRVVRSIQELDMLSGLSKADALAINPDWGESAPRDRLREQVSKMILVP